MRSGDVLEHRFVIDRLAGTGGMGEVYRALDRETDQPVALKVLRAQSAGDVARFEREARILSELDDPRFVRHIAHGTAPSGQPFLVMEWLDGEDLAHRLMRERLGISETIALGKTAAEALGLLHDRGVIHRDLKPANIFLVHGRTNAIKLLDLGIAHIESSTRMTGTGTLIGTFGYMSPEQANGAQYIDTRTDVFALGCVLFECLTGEPAFGGTTPMAILTKILFDEAPRLSERCTNVPADLDTLLQRLLSKKADERPPNGHAVAKALENLAETPLWGTANTVEFQRPPALTDSERRAVAILLLSAPTTSPTTDDSEIATIASSYGALTQRLLDGSLALLISGSGVVTDLAARAAHCALALSRGAAHRRVVLAMGRGHGTGFVPMGPAIDQAARLLNIEAKDRCVVGIDDAAAGLLDARFDIRDESGVYVLCGERHVAEVRTLLGKPTPCVGRERELRMLEGCFSDCLGDEPRAQAVLVTAPPGAGKSRLGREFLQKILERDDNVSLWIARAEQLRVGSAFALASQLVEHAAGIRGGEPLALRCEKLASRVAEHVAPSDHRRVTDFLGEMLGAPFPDEDNLPLRTARNNAQLLNDQIHAALDDFLAAECTAKPVVIVLEDVHWGDSPTIEALGRALENLAEKPLFILALARPEVHDAFPKLWAGRSVQEIGMGALSKKASERLVRVVLGDRVLPETVHKMVDLAAGNAFYLEELIRAAADGRGDNLPDTVVAMVQSRLDVLSDVERRILRAASIFGETVWTGAVSALLGQVSIGTGPLDDKLRVLVGNEVFVKHPESRFPNETEYAFRHALLREGAYAMLTDEDRALGHRLAGEWLERMGEDDPVVLAEHFEQGGNTAKAGTFWAEAAERAYVANDSDQGLRHAHRGLACAPPPATRNKILGTLCHLYSFGGRQLEAGRAYGEELHRNSIPGSVGWARSMYLLLRLATRGGDPSAHARILREILAAEMQPDAIQDVAMVLASMIARLDFAGNNSQAKQLFDKLEALTRIPGPHEPAVLGTYCAVKSIRLGFVWQDPWGALSHAKRAAELLISIGHRRLGISTSAHLTVYLWCLGMSESLKSKLLEAISHSAAKSACVTALVWALAEAREFEEARRHAAELIAHGKRLTLALDEGRGHWALAEVLRRSGDLEEAEKEIAAASALLRVVCPLDMPGVLATRAALYLTQGKPNEALAAAEEGLARMNAMDGACGFFRNAFVYLTHTESLYACGRHEDATAAIVNAKQWLFGIAAKIEDEKVRQGFLDNVPENRRILELAAGSITA